MPGLKGPYGMWVGVDWRRVYGWGGGGERGERGGGKGGCVHILICEKTPSGGQDRVIVMGLGRGEGGG